MTPCTPGEFHPRFGGTQCLHLQGQNMIDEEESRRIPSKYRLTSKGLHGITSQKIVLVYLHAHQRSKFKAQLIYHFQQCVVPSVVYDTPKINKITLLL
jgi:hypothetical protein